LAAQAHQVPPTSEFGLIDDEISKRYGQTKAHLARVGEMIPENDLWIAATCLVHDLILATRDAHFDRVPTLKTVKWDS
jgi:tRNA(fMet)-specific endonuclease VapC